MAGEEKGKCKVKMKILWRLMILLLITLNFLSAQELVNCLVAVVDRVPITWFDLRVIESFELWSEYEEDGVLSKEQMLNRYIERLLVLGLARGQVKVSEGEVLAEMSRLKNKFGSEVVEQKCQSLGMKESDLFSYLENKLLFEKIIGSRFNQKLYVSLKEIEDYYQKVYVPEEKSNGRTPAELITVLDMIEARLQNQKRRKQIKDWTEELKQRAEIMVYEDCLKKIR